MNTEEILSKLHQLIKEEHDKLQDRWGEIEKRGDNPFDEWNAFLGTLGLVSSVSYEYNWNEEYGVPYLINELQEIVNGDISVYVIDFDDLSNMGQTMFFNRKKVLECLTK
jgi:hypothetical protein